MEPTDKTRFKMFDGSGRVNGHLLGAERFADRSRRFARGLGGRLEVRWQKEEVWDDFSFSLFI